MAEPDTALQLFFTVGFVPHLEPLPQLKYVHVPIAEDAESDSDDELYVGQGVRLEPRLSSYACAPLASAMSLATASDVQEAATVWAQLLVLLDTADASPHFAHLRHFFDARLNDESEPPPVGEPAVEDLEGSVASASLATSGGGGLGGAGDGTAPENAGVERRGSFMSASRIARRPQWMRRPSLPATVTGRVQSEHVPPVPSIPRSLLGSLRRSSRRVKTGPECLATDAYELWLQEGRDRDGDGGLAARDGGAGGGERSDTSPRCIRFPVRLDLHAVSLAAAPHHWERRRPGESAGAVPVPEPAHMRRASMVASEDACGTTSSPRSSFMHRMLRRSARRGGGSAAGPSVHAYDPANADAVDSDDEDAPATQGDSDRGEDRAAPSTSSGLHRSDVAGVAAHPELGRVDEEAPGRRRPPDDLLPLLRRAAAFTGGAQRAWGAEDPLSTVLARALALAFGWEGVMHLCYGAGSSCAQQNTYSALGRAADLDSQRRRRYDAVLSWRTHVQPYDGDDGAQEMPEADDDAASLPTRRSSGSDDQGEEAPAARRPLAHHTRMRSWHDWEQLFTSMLGWISEYETARIQYGLAHEEGFACVHADGGTGARTATSPAASPSVVADAVDARHGFYRHVGVPPALRAEDGTEHHDYRWARERLLSSHVVTPAVISTAALQFVFHQLATSRWVYESAWELQYLDDCVFQSSVVRERFPPPGEQMVTTKPAYRPAPHEPDRSKPCPYPDTSGAWDGEAWRTWLSAVQEGDVIVPAVSAQAWWTLIAVLNGADRSGRWYNLRLKSSDETFADIDNSAVYM
ncbi:hypothetical protein MSPP1_004238 [Malassezia sp. CBS 17886]|nr:hypothetical protein MSPP1_004238 [Malassezia sp. CBS 17886]